MPVLVRAICCTGILLGASHELRQDAGIAPFGKNKIRIVLFEYPVELIDNGHIVAAFERAALSFDLHLQRPRAAVIRSDVFSLHAKL